MAVAETILLVLLVYLACGLLVGLPFVLRGVEQLDDAARRTSGGFRLLILPGTVALWPIMAWQWGSAMYARRRVRQTGGAPGAES